MSTVTEEEFRKLCQQHDLTYEYSDDGSVWRRGCDSLAKVQAAAKQMDRAVAERIWNEVVDTKIREDSRASWYGRF
jgi:hypothetical protein